MGCGWEGKFKDLQEHLTKECKHNLTKCEFCNENFQCDKLDLHKTECPMVTKECPLSLIGCHSKPMTPQELKEHIELNNYNHLKIFADKLATLEGKVEKEAVRKQQEKVAPDNNVRHQQ